MSDAGYILDKSPNFLYTSGFDGSYLLPTYDESDPYLLSNTDWTLVYSAAVAPSNTVVNGAYVFDTSAAGKNQIKQPYMDSTKQVDEFLHFQFDAFIDGSTWNGLACYFDSIDETIDELILTGTSTGFQCIIASGGIVGIAHDMNQWNTFNIYLIDGYWKIYVGNELKVSLNGATGGTHNAITVMEVGASYGYGEDIHVKNLSMEYNTTFRDGYNVLPSTFCTVTSSEASSSFPISNLYNRIPNKPCVFVNNDIEILIRGEIGNSSYRPSVSMTYSHLAILGHNFDQSAIITVSYGDSLAAMTEINIPWSDRQIIYDFGEVLSTIYLLIKVTDPVNSTNTIIGEVLLGKPVFFTECFFWGCTFNSEYNNIIHSTDFKARWIYHKNSIKSIKGIDFKMIKDDTVSELFDLFEEADGSRYPVLFFWDTRNADVGVIYGNLQDKFRNKLTFLDINDVAAMEIIGLPYAKAIEDDI